MYVNCLVCIQLALSVSFSLILFFSSYSDILLVDSQEGYQFTQMIPCCLIWQNYFLCWSIIFAFIMIQVEPPTNRLLFSFIEMDTFFSFNKWWKLLKRSIMIMIIVIIIQRTRYTTIRVNIISCACTGDSNFRLHKAFKASSGSPCDKTKFATGFASELP